MTALCPTGNNPPRASASGFCMLAGVTTPAGRENPLATPSRGGMGVISAVVAVDRRAARHFGEDRR